MLALTHVQQSRLNICDQVVDCWQWRQDKLQVVGFLHAKTWIRRRWRGCCVCRSGHHLFCLFPRFMMGCWLCNITQLNQQHCHTPDLSTPAVSSATIAKIYIILTKNPYLSLISAENFRRICSLMCSFIFVSLNILLTEWINSKLSSLSPLSRL